MNPSRIPFLLVVFLALGCGDAPGGGTPATSDAGLADALTPGDLFYVDSTQPADLVVAVRAAKSDEKNAGSFAHAGLRSMLNFRKCVEQLMHGS